MWSYTFDTIIRSKYCDGCIKSRLGVVLYCSTQDHSNSGSIHLAWCNHRLKQTCQRCYGMAWPFIQAASIHTQMNTITSSAPVQSCFPFDCGAQSLPCLATQSTVFVIVHHSHNDHITEILRFFPCGCYNTKVTLWKGQAKTAPMYLVWSCGLQTPIQWPISKYFGEPCWHGNRQRRVSFGMIYTHVWFTQLQYNSPPGKETYNHTYYIFSHPVFVWIAWKNSKPNMSQLVLLSYGSVS